MFILFFCDEELCEVETFTLFMDYNYNKLIYFKDLIYLKDVGSFCYIDL